jgi:type I restriction enzyme M protein
MDAWWQLHKELLVRLPGNNNVMTVRADFLDSFIQGLEPLGLLDRFKCAGVMATWWYETLYDFKSLVAQGFDGLLDGWINTRAAAMTDEDGRRNVSFDPAEDRLLQKLLPDYLKELEQAQQMVAELEQQKEAFELGEDADDFDADADDDNERPSYVAYLKDQIRDLKNSAKDDKIRIKHLEGSASKQGSIKYSEKKELPIADLRNELAQLKARIRPVELKIEDLEKALEPHKEVTKKLSDAKNHLKELYNKLVKRMIQSRSALSSEECQTLVLGMVYGNLVDQLEQYGGAHLQEVVKVVENWWDKYKLTAEEIEMERQASIDKVADFMRRLRYV